MGVQTSEVGYTTAMRRREDHEVHKDMRWHWTKKKIGLTNTSESNKIEILKPQESNSVPVCLPA